MEPKRQRELAFASVALVVLALAVWYRASAFSGGAASSGSGSPAAAVPGGAQNGKARPFAGVNLDALETRRPEPEQSVRNPFRFKAAAAPPAPAPSIAKAPQMSAPDLPAGPAQPPPPPRIALKYIGDMADPAKPGGKIAILSDPRGVYYGREGEVVEGRYRIVKIGVESIDLAYLDGRGRQTIRQNGQ